MKRVLQQVVLLTCLAVCLSLTSAQVKKEEYWEPIESSRILVDTADPEVRTLLSRWEAIGAGLSTTANPSSGTYEKFGYRGYFLRWSPENGFIYVYHSEGLSIIDFSYGKVTVTSEGVVFNPEREMKETFRGQKLKISRKWIPITVEERIFFVAEEEIKNFGDYVAGFGRYNDFNGACCEFSPFFTKSDKPNQHKSFPAVIPLKYQQLIKQPIKAQITFVGKKKVVNNYGLEGELYSTLFQKASLTPIIINAGRASGVRNNLLFRLIGEPGPQYLKITRVRNKMSNGVIIRDVDDDGKERFFDYDALLKAPKEIRFLPIRIGTRVTTSPISSF
jgi:hypothetical protein